MDPTKPNATARRILRGQNPEGSQACRSSGGAADEVRAGVQCEDGEADRAHNPTERLSQSR